MSAKGGKLKASDALLATSGALGIGAAASLPLLGADVILTPVLGVAAGLSLGVSKILKAFGAGISKSDLDRLKGIKALHDKRGNQLPKSIINKNLKFLNSVIKKHSKGGSLAGSGLLTGGSIKKRKGGALLTGGAFKMRIGSKRQVWNSTAQKTSGGLTKSDLMLNKRGKVVSKKKHAIGVKRFKENKLVPKTKEQLAELRKRR